MCRDEFFGAGDDLITPVYIAPTRPTTAKPSRAPPSSGGRGEGGRPCDDEEDCLVGSGSGEFNTDEGGLLGGAGERDELLTAYIRGEMLREDACQCKMRKTWEVLSSVVIDKTEHFGYVVRVAHCAYDRTPLSVR